MLVIGLSYSANNWSIAANVPGFSGCLEFWIISEASCNLRSRWGTLTFTGLKTC